MTSMAPGGTSESKPATTAAPGGGPPKDPPDQPKVISGMAPVPKGTSEAKPATGAEPGEEPPKDPPEQPGQVLSDQQIKDFRAEANNYATTKSVTQVIFTTSAIASNVTLWNQLDDKAARFGTLTALIWISVALNAFVILLATYLSFQRPKVDPAEDATTGGRRAPDGVAASKHTGLRKSQKSTLSSHFKAAAAGATAAAGENKSTHVDAALGAPNGQLDPVGFDATTTDGGSVAPKVQPGMQDQTHVDSSEAKDAAWGAYFTRPDSFWDIRAKKLSPKTPDFINKITNEALWLEDAPEWVDSEMKRHHLDLAERGNAGCCCWGDGTHRPYHGDVVEVCGVKVYSRPNTSPSWACCDLGCCGLFRVSGTGKGLGMLSVNPSKERKRQFMTAMNSLLNEVIGLLAVTIVIMNVIISALAPSTKPACG